jgi:hypothetical protein
MGSGVLNHGKIVVGRIAFHTLMDEIDKPPTKHKIQTRGVFRSAAGVGLWMVTLLFVHTWALLFYVWDFRPLFIILFTILSVIISVGCIEAVIGSPYPALVQKWNDIRAWHRILLLAIFQVVVSMLTVCIGYVMWLGPTPKVSGY